MQAEAIEMIENLGTSIEKKFAKLITKK